MLNDEFRKRVVEILADALELPGGEEREAFLRKACEDDFDLRRQVDSLLRAREQAGDFLGRSAFGDRVGPWEEEPGTLIGPYRLVEELGRGGFGVVFTAEQQEPVRRLVALKIIKLGMDTKEVIARFEAERQALALLDHPNIAHVYEAGVTDHGRPWFSMEWVKGEPITHYCESHRLSIKQRLELFLRVCEAVQHAHQRGLIHRDLKPSNILVTEQDGKPLPKIIDFGIAKSTSMRLSEQTLETRYDLLLGTPAYMSPEQAELSGKDVDTRSDIYSLGVLLYELLAGSPPIEEETLRKVALDEVRRIIREQDPPRPSTRLGTGGRASQELAERRGTGLKEACRAIRNDLDWIVLKAIEKEPDRRYATVHDLSADLHRHLKNEPVSACSPSFAYRTRKFMRRHQAGVLAGTAASLALAVGLVLAGIGFARADRERAEAETTIRLLRQALGADYDWPDLSRDFSIEDVLDRLSRDLDARFRGHPALAGEIHDILARAYDGLGVIPATRAHHTKALELRRQAYGERHPKVADSLVECAWLMTLEHRRPDAHAIAEQWADQAVQIYWEHPSHSADVANALLARAESRLRQKKLDLAEEDAREILAMPGEELAKGPHGPGDIFALAWANLGDIAEVRGDAEDAETFFRSAVEEARRSGHKMLLAICLRRLGDRLLHASRFAEAETVIREERELCKWARGEEHRGYISATARLEAALQGQGKPTGEQPERIGGP